MTRIVFLLASVALAVGLLFKACGDGSTSSAQTGSAKPNIIFILTDDLDDFPSSISYMPNLKRYLIKQGTTFDNAFVTTSICCPSRATILRGQYSHNHKVLTNTPPDGSYTKFRSLGLEKSTVATWLHSGGYRTVEIGKYANHYKPPVPPGWDEWHSSGWKTADAYPEDWLAHQGVRFIKSTKDKKQPFFMWLGTRAPHPPAKPPPRYSDNFPEAKAPRPPSFNEEDVSDKPAWIQEQPPFTEQKTADIDSFYRDRLRSMKAVDDLIGRLVGSLRNSHKLSNTYIFFTSDNGWTMGEHRRDRGKWAAYEEDINVPLIVRGPGVPKGVTRKHMVLNNDFAPTFARLGGVSPPSFVDGRSFVPLLRSEPPPPSAWRSAFLEEDVASEVTDRPALKAIRTTNYMWVEYADGERELYDLKQDPYELQNIHNTAPTDLEQHLSSRLDRLRDCARDSCRKAEGF